MKLETLVAGSGWWVRQHFKSGWAGPKEVTWRVLAALISSGQTCQMG